MSVAEVKQSKVKDNTKEKQLLTKLQEQNKRLMVENAKLKKRLVDTWGDW
jgi:regulator of replication initiation timing